MDVFRRFLAAGDIEVAAARRAGADEDRVPAFGQQRLHAVDTLAAAEVDAEAEDVAAFLVDDRVGQAELRDLRADHAAGLGVLVEDHNVIAKRGKVAGDGERGGATADKSNTLAVLLRRRLRQPLADIVLVVGGDALQAADRHRLVFDAHAPAGRFARAVAGAAEHAGKHIRMPIDHVGVGITPRGDQADIFRHRRMRRAGPLAIDDFMKVVGGGNIGILHSLLETRPATLNKSVSRRSS